MRENKIISTRHCQSLRPRTTPPHSIWPSSKRARSCVYVTRTNYGRVCVTLATMLCSNEPARSRGTNANYGEREKGKCIKFRLYYVRIGGNTRRQACYLPRYFPFEKRVHDTCILRNSSVPTRRFSIILLCVTYGYRGGTKYYNVKPSNVLLRCVDTTKIKL